jgi:simple sugar transport system permease protein
MAGTMFGVMLKSTIPAADHHRGATLSSWWGKIATGVLLLIFIVIQRIVVTYTARKKAT